MTLACLNHCTLDLLGPNRSRHARLGDLAWDAGRGTVLYLTNVDDRTALWEFDPETASRWALTGPGFDVTRFWLVEDPEVRLVFASDPACTERGQLYLLGRDGSVRACLEDAGADHHFAGRLFAGQGIVVANTATETLHRILQFDTTTGEVRQLLEVERPLTRAIALSQDRVLMLEEITNIDRRFCLFDVRARSLVPLDAGCGRIGPVLALSEADILFAGDLGGEWIGLHRMNLDTGTVQLVFKSSGRDVRHLCLQPDTGRIALTLVRDCAEEMLTIPLDDPDNAVALTSAPGHVHSMCFGPGDDLIAITSTPFDPPVARLHGAEARPKGVVADDRRDRVGRFASFDGCEIEYVILGQPEGGQIVVYLHGGPEDQYRREHAPILERLVERGIAVVAPNIRGSEGYGRAFVGLDDGPRRMDALGDVVALHAHLRDRFGRASGSIGIMGHSYGGFMTLLAITHHPELWSCAVDIAGMSHLGTFLRTAPARRRALRAQEYGDAEKMADFFDAIAPVRRVGDIRCPLLILHGDQDTRVPTSESAAMAEAVTAAGGDVTLRWIPGEGHFLTHRSSTEIAAEAATDFITGTMPRAADAPVAAGRPAEDP
ncbi:alpha/beta fold hydrolase [Roseivivax sediminis]|uniref:Dipeptidyl aminopeptidase/acylaminoacyl peptidase n=1 Tax=Roseivivax sediminis TaxID=936889 RepID=A0A1I1VCV6_9RHOB|nr:alpha/beta fold hydrolase [Roseivivax sediminis]SFD79828.1 Dipeptidyl aminopeptidase/acylaminoacyl peptidase [Roseivivax sediminis]